MQPGFVAMVPVLPGCEGADLYIEDCVAAGNPAQAEPGVRY
jgi:hypothetical protein